MNCKDFREIADSYLSNELLVETNHEVLQHLEACSSCRQELSARRQLRQKLRTAFQNSPENQINPAFSRILKNNLRESVNRKEKVWSFSNGRFAFAGVFSILILIFSGLMIWKNNTARQDLNPIAVKTPNVINEKPVSKDVQASVIQARYDAVNDHKDCALKFSLAEMPITLEEAAEKYGKVNKNLDQAVIKPLIEVFGKKAEFLEAHSCIINGRRFAHVVVKYQKKVVSVLLTRREIQETLNESDAISCQSSDNLRVACFESGIYSIFVVSDLSETENLTVARTISPSVKKHIKETETKS